MNTLLLIFFAIPIAVIIISIALQKIFKNPFLVAGIIFAIFLIITFAIGNLILLVATIAYTIISFITAIITCIICKIKKELEDRDCCRERCNCRRENSRCRRDRCTYQCNCTNSNRNNNGTQLLTINGDCSCNNDDGNLLTISSSGCNGIQNELLTINSNCNRNNNNDNNSCSCKCNTSNDSIAVRANVFPNSNTNGRSGSFCGCFRRR